MIPFPRLLKHFFYSINFHLPGRPFLIYNTLISILYVYLAKCYIYSSVLDFNSRIWQAWRFHHEIDYFTSILSNKSRDFNETVLNPLFFHVPSPNTVISVTEFPFSTFLNFSSSTPFFFNISNTTFDFICKYFLKQHNIDSS